MTQMGLDIETIEHLDFEFDPPCEMSDDDRTATWKLTISCCGHTILACEKCKNTVMEWAKGGKFLEHNALYGGCGSKQVTIIVCEKL